MTQEVVQENRFPCGQTAWGRDTIYDDSLWMISLVASSRILRMRMEVMTIRLEAVLCWSLKCFVVFWESRLATSVTKHLLKRPDLKALHLLITFSCTLNETSVVQMIENHTLLLVILTLNHTLLHMNSRHISPKEIQIWDFIGSRLKSCWWLIELPVYGQFFCPKLLEVLLHETQKIILHKIRSNKCKVRLNIKKLGKEI